MKKSILALQLAIAVVSVNTFAQPSEMRKPDEAPQHPHQEMMHHSGPYCFYAGQPYSEGAVIKSQTGENLVCKQVDVDEHAFAVYEGGKELPGKMKFIWVNPVKTLKPNS